MTAAQAAAGLQTIIQAAGAANDPSTLFMLSDVLNKQAQAMLAVADSNENAALPNTKVVTGLNCDYAFDINQKIWKYKDPTGKEQVLGDYTRFECSLRDHFPHLR
jgi:hypothetical protein